MLDMISFLTAYQLKRRYSRTHIQFSRAPLVQRASTKVSLSDFAKNKRIFCGWLLFWKKQSFAGSPDITGRNLWIQELSWHTSSQEVKVCLTETATEAWILSNNKASTAIRAVQSVPSSVIRTDEIHFICPSCMTFWECPTKIGWLKTASLNDRLTVLMENYYAG